MIVWERVIIALLLTWPGLGPSIAYASNPWLWIGDSHSGFHSADGSVLGSLLIQGLAAVNPQGAFYSACGSSARTWVLGGETRCGLREWSTSGLDLDHPSGPVPEIETLLAGTSPGVVLIELGDNLFDWTQAPDGHWENSWDPSSGEVWIRRLLARLDQIAPEARCIWIGPTIGGVGRTYRKRKEPLSRLYQSLTRLVGARCQLIDSRPLITSYVGSDGLHLAPSRSAEWGVALCRALGPDLCQTPGPTP